MRLVGRAPVRPAHKPVRMLSLAGVVKNMGCNARGSARKAVREERKVVCLFVKKK